MSVTAVGNSPVLIFGQPSDISEGIVTSFGRHGIAASQPRLPCDPKRVDSLWRTVDSASRPLPGIDRSTDSLILILDSDSAELLFTRHRSCSSRRRLRTYENDACELTVTTALTVGARRLLVAIDARRLTFGQRVRAIGRVRGLVHRVGYECSINGHHRLATHYTVIDTDDDVRRTAEAVVTWHRGLLSRRRDTARFVAEGRDAPSPPIEVVSPRWARISARTPASGRAGRRRGPRRLANTEERVSV